MAFPLGPRQLLCNQCPLEAPATAPHAPADDRACNFVCIKPKGKPYSEWVVVLMPWAVCIGIVKSTVCARLLICSCACAAALQGVAGAGPSGRHRAPDLRCAGSLAAVSCAEGTATVVVEFLHRGLQMLSSCET